MRLDAHYGMLPERAFEKRGFGHTRPATLEGGGKGGGGGGGPTQSTVYNTNIPEYAKPYVTSMLGATARQLFTGQEGADGNYEITGFRPYQPYSTDPTKYFAGPTGLQQQVYGEAQGMQTPGQFGAASGLAGAAGMGQLGTAQQARGLGQQGVGIGQMGMMAAAPAFQAGEQFTRGVTDPSRVGQFMSPYQQQVTDIAKASAIRDAQMLEQGNRLAAARQGTYGGARQALASLERERNLATNLANIQAQGSQAAYDRALQQMQTGANLGLQGIQTGLQGIQQGLAGTAQGLQGVGAQQAGYAGAGQAGATLGGLGAQQQQADLARMGFQQQTGAAQQQYQQNIINQAIQDYATAQQYPLMQLGFMSNMLRGLPMQATTTQSYMPLPSLGTQAISGLGTLYGASKAFGMKEGGKVPGYAGPEGSVVSGMRAKLEALADGPNGVQQVAQIAQSSPSAEMRKLASEVLMEKRMEEQAAAQAEASIAQDQMPRGLAAAPAPVLDTMEAASGGIVAFAGDDEEEGSLVNYDPNKVYADPYQVLSDAEAIARRKGQRQMMGIGEAVSPEYKQFIEQRRSGLPRLQEVETGENIMDFFTRLNRPGPLLYAATEAARESLPGIATRRKERMTREEAIAKMGEDVYGKERSDLLSILTGTDKEREDTLKRIANRREREISANAGRITDLDKTTDAIFADLVSNGGMDPKNPATRATARRMAIEQTGLAYQKMDLASGEKLYKALKDDKDLKSLRRQQMQYEEGSKEYQAIEDKIAAREQTIRTDFGRSQSTSGGTPGAISPPPKPDTSSGRFPKPDITKVKGAPEGSVIGEQTNKGWEVMNKDGKVIGYVQR